jgi:hypothetical protein
VEKTVAHQGRVAVLFPLKALPAEKAYSLSTDFACEGKVKPSQNKKIALPRKFPSRPVEGIGDVLDIKRQSRGLVEMRVIFEKPQDGIVVNLQVNLVVALEIAELSVSERETWYSG